MNVYLLIAALFLSCLSASAGVSRGHLDVANKQLSPGSQIDITGEWFYKPGYAVTNGEQPAATAGAEGYYRVEVPQFLNRIYWWLDDSEDFKRAETRRLEKLGFDTERAEDGWYRLTFDLPKLPENRHVFVQFDGVAMKSTIYCNGHRLGEHAGMFSRFEFDLTPHLKQGRNMLAVFVSMEKIPTSTLSQGTAVTVNLTASKVLTMSKGMFGPLSPGFDNRAYDLHGIWQPVRFVVRGPAKLDDVWFIPTTNSAEVRVQASALNWSQPVVLNAQWTDKKTGKPFAQTGLANILLKPLATQHSLELQHIQPKLWTPAEPNLYRLDVTLSAQDGKLLDAWSHNVGFRTFEVRGNKLYLNGRPWWLRGANHLAYGKNPWDAELPRKLIQMLHDANIRITRTHATPWNQAWLDAADEIGLGVSMEGIRPWALAGKIGATPEDMFQHWLMENEDVVRQSRNHPSVLLYTVGNEMMLRDSRNPDKWRQLSEVVKQTRRMDPTLPVIVSSEYHREREVFEDLLKPNGFDDGDVDDVHRYLGWYRESPFVLTNLFEDAEFHPSRPFIGQEISTGYPDLDTGLPVLRYTRDLLTPQAWVGIHSYPGSDPDIFLENNRAITKRLAEQLRWERGERTAGFMMFAAECWFRHSYDARSVAPYPVVGAMSEAFAPVGIALESSRRRFFSGEQLETAVFITNDDEQFRDLNDLALELHFRDGKSRKQLGSVSLGAIDLLQYYETRRVPVSVAMPLTRDRRAVTLILRLMHNGEEIGRSTEPLEIMAPPPVPVIMATAVVGDVGPALQKFLDKNVVFIDTKRWSDTGDTMPPKSIVLLGKADDLKGLAPVGRLRGHVEAGATVIAFSPGSAAAKLFPDAILDVKEFCGEYADWAPIAGTPLAAGLQPMDLKWWGRKDDPRAYVCSTAHRLKPDGPARELIRFIPAHGYIPAEKVPEQYRSVLFEIRIGKGRVWVCDLDLEACISVDPCAQRFAVNLLRAAADPQSTARLPRVPTHEELLKGRRD